MKHVFPRYPKLPQGTKVQRTGWLGEILIGTDGKVLKVWPLRENQFSPPFPAFNKAITDALNEWQFAPFVVFGKAVPICMPVFVGVHWE